MFQHSKTETLQVPVLEKLHSELAKDVEVGLRAGVLVRLQKCLVMYLHYMGCTV